MAFRVGSMKLSTALGSSTSGSPGNRGSDIGATFVIEDDIVYPKDSLYGNFCISDPISHVCNGVESNNNRGC